MNIKEAQLAIEGILASIPDGELPAFDKEEIDPDGRITVWWGGRGLILGSARRNGKRDPMNYRRSGSWDAIEGEMAYRRDAAFLAAGDKAEATS